MALLSLFSKVTTRAVINKQLDLDVSLSETHEASATLSQSEVEDGSIISDNVALGPLRLTIEGVVSKTPLNSSALIGSALTSLAGVALGATAGSQSLAGAAATTGVASLGGLISNAFGAGDVEGAKSRNPSDVWDYLLELRNKRLPMEIVTALRLYDNMVLVSLNTTRNSQTTGMLKFTATFEQVKIVKAQLYTGAVLGNAATPEAVKDTKLGKQGPVKASPKVTDDSSVLYYGFIK